MGLFNLSPTSSANIRKDYVDLRHKALFPNDDAKTARVKQAIVKLQAKNMQGEDWHTTYLRIHRALQQSELTINLDAAGWFSSKNKSGTYKQMYERAVGADGEMLLKNTDRNPALRRAIVDDLVTIPDDWRDAPEGSTEKRLHDALSATGAKQGAFDKSAMQPAQARRPTFQGDNDKGYKTTNAKFKIKAKQIFAALNYGQRAHGACTDYGFSYLVLNPALKQNALYYAGDTFRNPSGPAQQATFQTLGALLAEAKPELGDAMWKSCYSHFRGAPTRDPALLVEAHIFKKLKFAEDVRTLVLSRKTATGDLDDNQWKTVHANAAKWCKRHHVRLDCPA